MTCLAVRGVVAGPTRGPAGVGGGTTTSPASILASGHESKMVAGISAPTTSVIVSIGLASYPATGGTLDAKVSATRAASMSAPV